MQHSRDRILTTHTGSLPRPRALSELLVKQEKGKPVDANELARHIDEGVAQAVKGQIDAGLDVINDGEAPRVGFSTYVVERMSGFGGEQRRKTALDMQRFPGYADHMARQIGVAEDLARVWDTAEAQQAVHYEDSLAGVTAELADDTTVYRDTEGDEIDADSFFARVENGRRVRLSGPQNGERISIVRSARLLRDTSK